MSQLAALIQEHEELLSAERAQEDEIREARDSFAQGTAFYAVHDARLLLVAWQNQAKFQSRLDKIVEFAGNVRER